MPLTKNRIREIRSLSQKKGREELSLFVAEGLRLVTDAAESEYEIQEAYATARFSATDAGAHLMTLLRRRGARCTDVSARELAGIADTVHAQGVLALVRMKKGSAEDLLRRMRQPALLVALEEIADPGNLGSIIRTCDWFGAAGILLGRKSVDLYNPKVVRSTMGGIFHVPVVCGVDLPGAVARAKELGYTLFTADPAGSLGEEDARFPERSLIAFGSEARGVSEELGRMAEARVAIRRHGRAESLNVGVACGVLLAAYRRTHPGHRRHAEDP